MRYSCLIFDHDDTVVNSTSTIHYPSFIAFLNQFFPGKSCTLEEYFKKNFDPGFLEYCQQELGMTDQDLNLELEFWRSYVKSHVPQAFPGIREIMQKHKAAGGQIAVISHSIEENILRDYAANDLPEPDLIFGWEQPPEHRKPYPWPVEQIAKEFDLSYRDLLMIDDLKPGYDMALAAGIDFAAAGWAYSIPSIESFMRSNCDYYFNTVDELKCFLIE